MNKAAMNRRTHHTSTWTYDEYARLPDDGDRHEIIRGEVCVTPGPRPRHQWVAFRLHRALSEYVERHGLGVVLQDVDLLFESGEFLRPDILFVRRERLSGITTRGVESAPDLVIEVLSPGSERIDRVKKPPRYAELGVPGYWLVDPEREAVEVFRAGEAASAFVTRQLEWQPDQAVRALSIDVPALFERW
jgi:Uma2 family endonuclease